MRQEKLNFGWLALLLLRFDTERAVKNTMLRQNFDGRRFVM
jgi:hypothetical protein